MFAPLLVLALAAAPAPTIKLASPGLGSVGVSPDLLAYVTDHLNHTITMEGIQVVGAADIAATLGLERQKQMLGCGETATSCLTELANALGADGIVRGSIARLGDQLHLDVKVVSASDARPLAVFTTSVRDEAALPDAIRNAAASVAKQVSTQLQRTLQRLGPEATATAAPATPPTATTAPTAPTATADTTARRMEMRNTATREIGQWTLVGGGVLTLTGLVVLGSAVDEYDPNFSLGGSVMLVGLLGVLVGGGMFLFGGMEPVPLAAGVSPLPSGFALSVAGAW